MTPRVKVGVYNQLILSMPTVSGILFFDIKGYYILFI